MIRLLNQWVVIAIGRFLMLRFRSWLLQPCIFLVIGLKNQESRRLWASILSHRWPMIASLPTTVSLCTNTSWAVFWCRSDHPVSLLQAYPHPSNGTVLCLRELHAQSPVAQCRLKTEEAEGKVKELFPKWMLPHSRLRMRWELEWGLVGMVRYLIPKLATERVMGMQRGILAAV